jgi:hypothetical protein
MSVQFERIARIAVHTVSAVHGISMCVTPRCETASITALWMAGVEPIVPDSPMPFAPNGLRGLSVCVFDVSKLHNSEAAGRRQSVRSTITGTWSDAPLPLRSSRSIVAPAARPASAGDAQQKSMRSPLFRGKASCW